MSDETVKPLLSVALIGCGRVGVKHLNSIFKAKDSLQLCALVDTDIITAKAFLEKFIINNRKAASAFPRVKFYTGIDALLLDMTPDIVAITVPSGFHYEIAYRAISSGCHILLEKPMTMKTSEAKELYDLSVATGRHIAMGHIYRYLPIMGLIHQDFISEKWGKISHGSVVVRWGHDQAYYDQAAWRGTWKLDGGALMNQSIHALDLMCYLMNTYPVSVVSQLAKRFRNMEAEDIGAAVLRMENGALCVLEGTTATSPSDHEASFYINAELGSLRVGLRKGLPFFDIRDKKGKKVTRKYYREELKAKGLRGIIDAKNPHYLIYRDLINCVRNGDDPIADARSGYKSVEAMLSVYRSAKEHRQIDIPGDSDFDLNDMSGYFN
ncbi:MAG: Gfo/Idh/MocA family oxidoreductase [Clostridiaceae bacterium]|jgi:predicted dehydrogenase|nr:Gfo/Idh/MocA family oxidoreductase [Clostridiaceae bacterium]